MDADGTPQHPGDMAAQLESALDNLEAILAAAEMSFADVVRLNVYATDVDELFKHWARIPGRFGGRDDRFVTSVLGVTRLAAPERIVMLEATAVN